MHTKRQRLSVLGYTLGGGGDELESQTASQTLEDDEHDFWESSDMSQ